MRIFFPSYRIPNEDLFLHEFDVLKQSLENEKSILKLLFFPASSVWREYRLSLGQLQASIGEKLSQVNRLIDTKEK